MTDPKTYLDPAEEKMEMAVMYLDETLQRIRAGKANPKILEGIRVEYYGSQVPISNVANVSTPDARTIAITPWEKAMFKEIEKAIINSELGITPENNGEVIRLGIPPLTEEDVEKDAETTAQKIHDKYLKKIDEIFAAKEKEILTV